MAGPDAGADGIINVHFPWMSQAADDVRACHNTLIQEQADLAAFLNSGLLQDWHGRGGASWAMAQHNWDQSADSVYTILGDLYRALSDAHTNYTMTEHSLESFWST
jgi:WXG100 family type VII secretion target